MILFDITPTFKAGGVFNKRGVYMAKIIPVNRKDLNNLGISGLDFSKGSPDAFLVIPNTEEIKNESPLVRAIISELGGVEIIPYMSIGVKEIFEIKS